MNREIKFRGKTFDGQWVYGNLMVTKNRGVYIKSNDDDKIFGSGIEVHPETVGQYTGLKDKNGSEIYEGDVMYHESHEATTFVKWVDKFVCFAGESLELADTNYYYQSIDQSRLVIKGTIHDNPELIK